ncbi:MAG: shikimate dehydrogenase [Gemmatimonadota bacterium]|nr:shikimate dehydrogenase [Gemmatimonadota bacterium]
MTPRPRRLVLLGHPVAHSLSPRMQNAALRAAGIPLRYEPLDVPAGALDSTLDALIAEDAAGNVTIPHKAAVAARCAVRTPIAERAGAVNTFWVEHGRLVGDNTDVDGFDDAIRELIGALPAHVAVGLVGAGGAAAAVLAAIERWGDCRAGVYNRSEARARALADRFPALATVAATADEAVRGAALVINATSVGLHDDAIPVPVEALDPAAAVLDLVYRRGDTALVRAARARGRRAAGGLAMLVGQGARAFRRWFGVEPDRRVMWEALQDSI